MEFFRTRIWRKKSYLSTQYHQITPLYQHADFSHRQVRRYPIFSLMVSKIELYLHRLNVKSIHEEMNVLCLSQYFIVMWTFKLNCWYEAWFTEQNRNLIWLFFYINYSYLIVLFDVCWWFDTLWMIKLSTLQSKFNMASHGFHCCM